MTDMHDAWNRAAKKPGADSREPGPVRRAMLYCGIGAGFVLAAFLLWTAGYVLLQAFAGILLAILLSRTSRRVEQWLPLHRDAALALVVTAALGVLGIFAWLAAPVIGEQANQLADALASSFERLREWLQSYAFVRNLPDDISSTDTVASQASTVLARAGGFFSGLIESVVSVAIILFVGIYLAARPDSYIDGFVMLIPPPRRARAREVLAEIGHTLGQWLTGKLVSMLIVGIFTTAGLTLLGIPMALVLGILAGLLDFIPYIGPLMAGVPAVVIALSEDPTLALYVLLLFVALQTAEGYLLLPLIERRTVSMPPALTIFMQALLGAFAGLGGVALATPLTAVLAVLVAMLYVQDVLGDRARIPGE